MIQCTLKLWGLLYKGSCACMSLCPHFKAYCSEYCGTEGAMFLSENFITVWFVISSPCHIFNQSPRCFVTTSSVLCCCFKAMLLFRMLRLHTCSTGPHWHKMEESKKMNLTIRLNIYMEKATGVVYQALKLHWKIKLTILLLWALVKKSSRLSGIKNLAIKHRQNCKVTFVHIKTVLT